MTVEIENGQHAQEDPGIEPSDKQISAPEGKDGKKSEKKTVRQEILSWVWTILGAVLIASVIRALLFEPIRVDGKSMVNTLQDGEIVLVTKPEVLLGKLKRGDVVICRFPNRNSEFSLHLGASLDLQLENHTLFVKRLVALPGDSVAILDGTLYVNDKAVEEDYVDYPPRTDYKRRVLDDNEYMVMGDNRAGSHDSRALDVGPISGDMLVGHARYVLFPFSAIRSIR